MSCYFWVVAVACVSESRGVFVSNLLLLGWRPLLKGWMPSLVGSRPSLLSWRRSLFGCGLWCQFRVGAFAAHLIHPNPEVVSGVHRHDQGEDQTGSPVRIPLDPRDGTAKRHPTQQQTELQVEFASGPEGDRCAMETNLNLIAMASRPLRANKSITKK